MWRAGRPSKNRETTKKKFESELEDLREESSSDSDSSKHNTVSIDDMEYRLTSSRRRKIGHLGKESKELRKRDNRAGRTRKRNLVSLLQKDSVQKR